MLKRYFFLFVLCGLFFFACPALAYEHGYSVDSDDSCAVTRYDMPVYESAWGDYETTLAAFHELTVIDSYGSWYEITYSTASGTGWGAVTKEDFAGNCLLYDGREKQILADGTYRFRFCAPEKETSVLDDSESVEDSDLSPVYFPEISFQCRITFLGNDTFKICRYDTGKYLMSDDLFKADDSAAMWGDADDAGTFQFVRKGGSFGIRDTSTHRYLGEDDHGCLAFVNYTAVTWQLRRTKKAVGKSNLRVFVQFDPEWADIYYGSGTNPDPETNNLCTSGCGIFSVMNAIYSLTGQYADPVELAHYSVKKHYRIEDNGTDVGFFKAAAEKFGPKYGFAYDGSGESLEQLKKKLQKGDTAIAYVPGHYAAIVDYDKASDRYLFLDSRYMAKRGTCSFGDWVSAYDLTEGDLEAQMFYYYKPAAD